MIPESDGAGAVPMEMTHRRIVRLMVARLVLSLGVLGVALIFVGAGRDGAAVAFCAPDEMGELKDIQKAMGVTIPVASGRPWADLPDPNAKPKGRGGPRRRNGGGGGFGGGGGGGGQPRNAEGPQRRRRRRKAA